VSAPFALLVQRASTWPGSEDEAPTCPPPCICGTEITDGQTRCQSCSALRPKLLAQAERLSKFLENEWSFKKCLDYLTSLSAEDARELWDDVHFQVSEEAQGRSGTQTLEVIQKKDAEATQKKDTPRLCRLIPRPDKGEPCCRCGARFTEPYYDSASPITIVWVCDRCSAHGLQRWWEKARPRLSW
jgi:hypothetical protein